MGGRDHSCEVCGRGGFNDPDGVCECAGPECLTCGSDDPCCPDPFHSPAPTEGGSGEALNYDKAENELVEIVDEGKKVRGDGVIGPEWSAYSLWKRKTSEFLDTVFGGSVRVRFESDRHTESLGELMDLRIQAVEDLLARRTEWRIRVGRDDLQAAIETRRTYSPQDEIGAAGTPAEQFARIASPNPGEQIEDLIREGIELRDELTEEVGPKEAKPGVYRFDSAPTPGAVEKAAEFDQRCRALLTELQPSLLTDYAAAANRYLEKDRAKADQTAIKLTKADDAAKLDAWFREIQIRPAVRVEACLEGLAAARKGLDQR